MMPYRLLLMIAMLASGCRTAPLPRGAFQPATPTAPATPASPALTENERAKQLLCADIAEDACTSACSDTLAPRAHAECLIDLRFGSDPEALDLARALYAKTSALVGIDTLRSIEGYRGQSVELLPALPIGVYRHHLAWLSAGLDDLDAFVASLRSRAGADVAFQPRPRAFLFFRTADRSYPSAYFLDGSIGYNLEGPLNTNARDVQETLFHELFHLNDASRAGGWSEGALKSVFESIIERCGNDHDCLTPFAPHGTVVPEGTYYPFDERTRDVREYAAELALRYFLEHEVILAGKEPSLPPFKCLSEENGIAWARLADEFFGGADLSPACDELLAR
jgi:hypothetical protein